MTRHLARIFSYAVFWITALTGSALATEKNPPGDIPDDQVFVPYTSSANPLTNKRIRLEDAAYVFYKNGKMAILTVWAPAGADNADQWKLISESFRW